MTMSSIENNGRVYNFDENSPIDISIPLHFEGPQPNAYGVEPATATACEYGPLIGDARRGGSCNFEQVTLTTHCNGTHTECVGHITKERLSVRECLKDVFVPATLVSIEPERTDDGDLVISSEALTGCGVKPPANAGGSDSLILRTLPNDEGKLSRLYNENSIPSYFTADAMEYVVECGFKHLLVDLPSIDRLFDEGKLTNHRIFWTVEPGSFETNTATRIHSTITELIYVPDNVKDGEYMLNLQIAPFEADAAPSRPILLPI
jgi:arylformamidase